MTRALRYDGLLPVIKDPQTKMWQDLSPESLRPIKDYFEHHQPDSEPFDVIVDGETPGDEKAQAAEFVLPWRTVSLIP
jgi:hypothetical protein